MAVARYLSTRPDVDGSRMGLLGVSYGGYMTCWTIAHTSLFAAAVAENPVTDLRSYALTTADGGAFIAEDLGSLPWENPDLYRKLSPLTRAADIRTPLLLVHGELDHNCPINQSEQMYTALRRLDRDVTFLRIPDEGHGMVLDGTVAHRPAAVEGARRVPIRTRQSLTAGLPQLPTPSTGAASMFTVLQVDNDASLEPFVFERERLAELGGTLVVGGCTSEDELIDAARGAQVLWLAWKPGITRRVLHELPALELVVRWGVGYDQIDVAAATELGVAVANAPGYGTIDVAEHVIALLMAGSRRIAWYHEDMRAGGWPPAIPGSTHRVAGRTLGIVGMGRIGSAVAQRAAGLGLDVLGCDSGLTPAQIRGRGASPVALDELLASSDFVSLHVPLSPDTGHFMDAAKIGQMKSGAALINASRGKVVDTNAVLAALDSGQMAWAALDVYEQEPLPSEDPLRVASNVILTPHVAGFSDEAWQDLRAEMCSTTLEWVRDGWASTIVNPGVRQSLRRIR